MAVKRKREPKNCLCGGECKKNHPRLPGYLLIAFGLMTLPINFDLMTGFEWAKAWPLLLVLLGVVIVLKVSICKSRS